MEPTPLTQPRAAEKGVETFKPVGLCHRPDSTGMVLVDVSRFATRKSWMML